MSDRLAVFHDPKVLDHDTGRGVFEAGPMPFLAVTEDHPENADRVRNMVSILEHGPLAGRVEWHGGDAAPLDDMALFHDRAYLDGLAALDPAIAHNPTSTTVFGPGSWPIVRLASGLAIAAARHVWQGAGNLAYALVRPPGHHAQPAVADGYCFINNIGVAINVLRRDHGLTRACVIDWDVHHGNGTQDGFFADPDVLTVSMHMDHGAWGDTHRQTGAADEVGSGAGVGKNLNVPLPYGCGDEAYRRAFDAIVAPAVRAHAPELIVIACGQDANQFDPNGRQLVSMAGFRDLGARARALADELTGGKLLLVQEGGYAISYAAMCLHATMEGVLGTGQLMDDPIAFMPEVTDDLDDVIARIQAARDAALAG